MISNIPQVKRTTYASPEKRWICAEERMDIISSLTTNPPCGSNTYWILWLDPDKCVLVTNGLINEEPLRNL